MTTARILNRAAATALSPTFTIPDDGFFHLARKGEFPGEVETPDGKTLNVIQVIDDEAISLMYNSFKEEAKEPDFAGLLVDRDHLSADPNNSTEAEGWIDDLRVRNGNLDSKIRLSDLGRQDITGGRYRYISGVWDVRPIDGKKFTEGCRVRPFKLIEAGLTNRPNITGLNALSNRKNNLPENPANSPAEQADIQNRNKKTMKQIATKLGLSADASEDAILGELSKLYNRAETAEGKVKPLTEELATVKNRLVKIEEDNAEAELERAGIKKTDADHAMIKTALIANREGGLALLKRIKPATSSATTQTARQTNRSTAQVPANSEAEIDPKTARRHAARVRNRATALRKANPRLNFRQAWEQAEAEVANPEEN